mgnify:FL=1
MNSKRQVKIILLVIFMAAAAMVTRHEVKSREKVKVIGKQQIEITNGKLTPEVLWAMGRIGSVAVSPDESKIAYQVTYYDIDENKGHTVICTMNSDGTNNIQLTKSHYNEHSPAWLSDGRIAFISNRSGKQQIWAMDADGKHKKQLSFSEKDIEGFLFSPDESQVLMVMSIPNPLVKEQQYEDLPKATGIVAEDLMYRHWDNWVTSIPHPFIATFNGEKVSDTTLDLLNGEPYESPMLPFGGIEQFAWSPDSKTIAYTSRKKVGLEQTKSTDSDIYFYTISTGETTNICKIAGDSDQNMGYDINPQYSPDGKYIAWQSMERDGYESDRNRLYVMDLETKKKWSVSEEFDSNVDAILWDKSNHEIFFIGSWHGRMSIFKTDLEGHINTIHSDNCDYGSITWGKSKDIIATRQSLTSATEIYRVDARRSLASRLSHENDHIFSQLNKPKVEERWIETTDGKSMLTWVVYPPEFDASKKYPTLLYCQGGPQSMVSQFWSYRWNLNIMASQGYIVVAPNRRGLPGFGQEWNEAISGDYGGQCMKDLLTAIDEVSKEPFVDKDRLGCVGASFGGYSVYWMAGHHEGRFKAFIAHDGIFNTEQQYLETEEMWFPNWDFGGPYWEKNEKTARTYANSPHLFVDKWDTPILCIHGEKDYRILYSQAVAAFNAAQLRGIPSELLLFPDENHWVTKPQNSIMWQRRFFGWLDRWLKI